MATTALKLRSAFYSNKYDCLDMKNLSADIFRRYKRPISQPAKGSLKKNMISIDSFFSLIP